MKVKGNLTDRQAEIYEFIKEKILNRGYGPTVREIGREVGIGSTAGVLCHLRALERKGVIKREPGLARAVQLTDQPESPASLPSVGRLSVDNPFGVLERGNQLDFTSLFEAGTFCVTVTGNILLHVHISDGDALVFQHSKHAENGDIVLASIEDAEPVLRVFYKEESRVRLEASRKTDPITYHKVRILGRAIALIRLL